MVHKMLVGEDERGCFYNSFLPRNDISTAALDDQLGNPLGIQLAHLSHAFGLAIAQTAHQSNPQ